MPRKRHFRVGDSVWRENWTNDELAGIIRLQAWLNDRWARDGIPTQDCGKAVIPIAHLIAITQAGRADYAIKAAQRWPEMVSLRLSLEPLKVALRSPKGDLKVSIDWPKFVEFQHGQLQNSSETVPSALRSPLSASGKKKMAVTNKSVPATAEKIGLYTECPEPFAAIEQALKDSHALTHRSLFDWVWWTGLCKSIAGCGVDPVQVIKNVDVWLMENPHRAPISGWKRFLGGCIRKDAKVVRERRRQLAERAQANH